MKSARELVYSASAGPGHGHDRRHPGHLKTAVAALARGVASLRRKLSPPTANVSIVTMSPTPPPPQYADVYVERLTIRNFRGISECEVEFEPGLTVLVGRNNVGKSRILSALHLALAGRPADVDDFTVGSTEEPEIDVVISPSPAAYLLDEETFDDQIARRLGQPQSVNETPLRERFAWRTHVRRSGEGMGARSDYRVLTFDANAGKWAEQTNATELTRNQRSVIASDLVNTGRDLMEELARRGSSVRKVLSDLGVDDAVRATLEQQLADLSEAIVAGSNTLGAVTGALHHLNRAIGSIGAPGVNPLPITLEELARTLSIDLDSGNGSLPIRFHGAGARSLASLQVQGVLYDRLLGADGGALRPHPTTLVEEPEAHLHPQACAELPALLRAISGQVIASTHSAQVVTATDPRAIRLIRDQGKTMKIVDLGPAETDAAAPSRVFRPSLHTEEMEKLKRLAERPFGEILFASALIIGDGATERGLLPPLLRHALGAKSHGICVIDPDSMSTAIARAAAKFADVVGIPWVLFADSDASGIAAANALAATGNSPVPIIWAGRPDPTSQVGYADAAEAMIIDFDAQLAKEACERVRPDKAPVTNVLATMKGMKGGIGPTLAELLIDRHPDHTTWPKPLLDLIEALDERLS